PEPGHILRELPRGLGLPNRAALEHNPTTPRSSKSRPRQLFLFWLEKANSQQLTASNVLPGHRTQVAPADLRGGHGAGAHHAHAQERRRARAATSRLSLLGRARGGEDDDGPSAR